jgi:hypothetical protein
MRATLVRHRRHIRSGNTAAQMIGTQYVGRPNREVERANSGHYSYKTAHVGLILSVRLQLM